VEMVFTLMVMTKCMMLCKKVALYKKYYYKEKIK